jgi:hypothetical protein
MKLGFRRQRKPLAERPDEGKRRANSLIHDWLALHDGLDVRVGFVCECPRAGCTEAVWLTGEQFERATRDPAWAARI